VPSVIVLLIPSTTAQYITGSVHVQQFAAQQNPALIVAKQIRASVTKYLHQVCVIFRWQ